MEKENENIEKKLKEADLENKINTIILNQMEFLICESLLKKYENFDLEKIKKIININSVLAEQNKQIRFLREINKFSSQKINNCLDQQINNNEILKNYSENINFEKLYKHLTNLTLKSHDLIENQRISFEQLNEKRELSFNQTIEKIENLTILEKLNNNMPKLESSLNNFETKIENIKFEKILEQLDISNNSNIVEQFKNFMVEKETKLNNIIDELKNPVILNNFNSSIQRIENVTNLFELKIILQKICTYKMMIMMLIIQDMYIILIAVVSLI